LQDGASLATCPTTAVTVTELYRLSLWCI